MALSTWDEPDRVGLRWPIFEAVRSVGAQPNPEIPVGPDFFQFSDSRVFAELLRSVGLDDVQGHVLEFTHHVPSAGRCSIVV